ncbi:hypothetical protein EMA8858_04053 [Emticicia aquatica]|uniref:MBOAT family protein n=1 Tax=Emticicia aquatica TaxID=1681835 RepID=A0ABM9AWD9_9BACT|nr:MBOAT family O-acyltransferase [Emticicia aquatica]CAH0997918.1 hypothetical protein EMA8858_04053 [Emticicia aquatica]
MLFTSFPFFILLIITFGLYYTPILANYQVYILVLASFIFYAFSEPILILLLIFSPAINIITSYYITYGSKFNKKSIAIAGVLAELGVLVFFKYSPLISKTFLNETDSIGLFLLTIPLPIGISFFTFEGISLVIDVYTEKYFDRKKYISYSFWTHAKNIYCFISFFPHLIAGPIVKAHDFLPQIQRKTIQTIDWQSAFKKLILGYFLKMFVADNLKDFTFGMGYPFFYTRSTIDLLVTVLGYSCQIFADFAGYSLIAIGLAKLFGYELMQNFNFPYISSSFREFWKRWHISLSTFLMEYLYIPMGGNKKGKLKMYLFLMLTMFIGGLWHGASWNYAIWGVFHGLALVIERFLGERIQLNSHFFTIIIKRMFVFTWVTFAWILFKLTDFSHVIDFFKTLAENRPFPATKLLIVYILLYSLPVFLYHQVYLLKDKKWLINIKKFDYYVYGLMLFLIITNAGSIAEFIYFQF